VVVALSSLLVWLLGLDARGVAIVGAVPAGLPSLSWPAFDLAAVRALWPTALAIAVIGFVESIAVARAFARRRRQTVDADRELLALGAANAAAGVSGALPVAGGFSRTAVNAQAGARTGLAGLITAALVGLTLLFFTPLFYYLPNAVLAAVIMSAVFGLVDVAEVRRLWRVERRDLALLGLTFTATLALGIEVGLAAGVVASVLALVGRVSRPRIAVLGRLPGTELYRDVARNTAETVPGVLVIRVDAQLCFANAGTLVSTLRRLEAEADRPLRAVVLDASGVNQIDSSASAALEDIAIELAERGVALHLAAVKAPVREVLARDGLLDLLGEDRLSVSVHQAVERAR
jgi:sulfate permease, SulP family